MLIGVDFGLAIPFVFFDFPTQGSEAEAAEARADARRVHLRGKVYLKCLIKP